MHRIKSFDISYYPGCSMATTARESNLSLLEMFNKIGFNLVELEDWNCCGSTSAHNIDPELALDLAVRNLFLSPPDRPLLVACPNCILRLRHAHLVLKQDDLKRRKYENEWGTTYNTDLNILHFFDLLENINLLHFSDNGVKKLQGLRFVPYYGCMLSQPNALQYEKEYYGLMEKILCSLGGEALSWPFKSRCCGTFLSVAKPDIITPIVNKIIQGAMDAGADCIVTACAMCHLNLEVRCSLKNPVPTIHFSELLSLALGESKYESWFPRHLVDPRPMLKSKGLIR